MWRFRLVYSILIFVVFITLRHHLGIDIYFAIVYSIGIVLAINIIENIVQDLKSLKVVSGFVGGLTFILIGYLIAKSFEAFFVNDAFKMGFLFIFTYLGIFIGYKNSYLLEHLSVKMQRKNIRTKYITIPKILDTSSIIDGRIKDIIESDFFEGRIVVPNFVLKELQSIADSHDHLRRQKGRRGLDTIKIIQEQTFVPVEVVNDEFANAESVDDKLILLAGKIGGKIVTTDYNLIKVAEIQNIKCLNVNLLSLALRQNLLPGEEIVITIQKEGKEYQQGVGYLDDGTMVVIENGRSRIGETLDMVVTSLLQSESGRIIFAKIKQ